MNVPDVLTALKSGRGGLSGEEAGVRLRDDGPNELPAPAPRSALRRLAGQVSDPMVLLLLGAAVLALVVGEAADAVVIVAIVVVNAGIGAGQEGSAERALLALRNLVSPLAIVLRDGKPAEHSAAELVRGDVVRLEAGRMVPADVRLLEAVSLRVDESALTGESLPLEKAGPSPLEPAAALGERVNMAYRGTLVTHGHGAGAVVGTGRATELGRISALMEEAEEVPAPLQRRLRELSRRLALVAAGLCAVVFGAGVLRGEAAFLMLLTAVSLAVAAIPEALPAVMTLCLALGAQRMARKKALVRRLPAVEALGSVTVICADKTGTLTENRMCAQAFHCGGRTRPDAGTDPVGRELLTGAALCSDVEGEDGRLLGDPTEVALAEAAVREGLDVAGLRRGRPRLAEVPFDAQRRMMTTVHADGAGRWVSYTKGAAESLLARAAAVAGDARPVRAALDAAALAAESLAAEGYRVIAVAARRWTQAPSARDEDLECGLTLIGLVGLLDPPRPEAAAAIETCLRAGIRPIMITGDHPLTARAVARRLGLPEGRAVVLTGAELEALAEPELLQRVQHVSLYARVAPEQKLRIVRALQARGHVVAMTGDGVNDAPALRQAEIGVAMGRGGTDVAREAADMVLLDDNFATIVQAVAEGRRIYANARRFVRYIVSTNAAEVLIIFAAPLLGLPLPLLPLQILWINLMTDSAPALALAFEPAEPHIMDQPPRPPSEGIFARGLGWHVTWVAVLMAALCLAAEAVALAAHRAAWQTIVFSTLCLAQLANAMAIRSDSVPLWRLGLLTNRPLLAAVVAVAALQAAVVYVPWLQEVFGTTALGWGEALLTLGAAGLVYAAIEVNKLRRVPSA
jgi:P-type Ca2+ transporter type 2C